MAENDIEIIIPEDEKPVICPKCNTVNPEGSNFCLFCGISLKSQPSSNANWIWLFIFILLCSGLLFHFHQRISRLEPQKRIPEIPQATAPVIPKEAVNTVIEEFSRNEIVETTPDSQKIKIPVGLVVIKDITGKVIHEVPAAVVGGGWVALPNRICLGGFQWVLRLSSDRELRLVGGIVGDYDKIGLWRIQEDQTIEGPELYSWSADEPLAWLSLMGQNSPEPVPLESPNEQGYFIEGILPVDFDEMGVLVQQDRLVGWTFGDFATGAFVWNGDEGKFLRTEIRVEDFYRITFANSREEEFSLALAMMEDYSVLERLEAFANGFRLDPKLSPIDTPAHLQTKAISEKMRSLIAKALQAGYAREVAYIFDAQILAEAGDVELLMAVAQATTEGYGFEDAIELTENVVDSLPKVNERDFLLLEKIFSSLYQSWIVDQFKKENFQNAWRAYRLGSRRLPNDLALHLLGVELALAEDNWTEAERLLSMKEYPASLIDKVKNLQARISELKAQEGKIVIRFTPGIRHIPVTAILNRNSYQTFIVDTGASMVTIPRSSAEKLGLAVDERSPSRKVYTAGGVKFASEVMLSSITVEGWEVNNVKALVLDIPDQPGLGLLGLNYLRRFRMDINSEQGVLLLEPR